MPLPLPSTAHPVARIRLALARRRRLYWWAVGVAAAVVGLVVERATHDLTAARDAWGRSRTVLVVSSPTAAGDTPRVEARSLPVAALPESALVELPVGAVAAHHLDPGVVITPSDLVEPTAAEGVRLAVPARGAPVLLVGQRALLLAADGTRCDGPVVGTSDEWIDVAVPSRCAAAVALALLAGDLVVGALGS